MNIVVRPDDTLELDQRTAAEVAVELLGSPTNGPLVSWVRLDLHTNGELVGQALFHAHVPLVSDAPRNHLAQRLVMSLTGAHARFYGPVVLANLSTDLAHRLIDEL